MPTIEELGQRIKAKYPGAYDDVADGQLGRRIKAKFPGAYDDFSEGKPDQLETAVRFGLKSGPTMGLGNTIAGGIDAAVGRFMPGFVGGDVSREAAQGDGFLDRAANAKKYYDARDAEAAKENPVTAAVAGTAGAIAGPLRLAKAIPGAGAILSPTSKLAAGASLPVRMVAGANDAALVSGAVAGLSHWDEGTSAALKHAAGAAGSPENAIGAAFPLLAGANQNAAAASRYWKDTANKLRTNVLFPKNTQAQGAIREQFGTQEAAGQAIKDFPGGDLASPDMTPQGRANRISFVKTKAGEEIGAIRQEAERAGAKVDTEDVFTRIRQAYARRFGGPEIEAAPGAVKGKARAAEKLVSYIEDTFRERFKPTSTNVAYDVETPALNYVSPGQKPVAITHKATGATIPLAPDKAQAPRTPYEVTTQDVAPPGVAGRPGWSSSLPRATGQQQVLTGGEPDLSGGYRPLSQRVSGEITPSTKRLYTGILRPQENTGWGVAFEDRFPALPDQPVAPTSTNVEVKGLPLTSWTRLKKIYSDRVNNMQGLYARPDANIKNDPMLAFLNEVDGIIAGAEDAAISRSVPHAADRYAKAKANFGTADTLRGPTQLHADTVAAGNVPGGSSRGNLSSARGIIGTVAENSIAAPLRARVPGYADALSRYSANPRDEMDPKTLQALTAYYLRNKE